MNVRLENVIEQFLVDQELKGNTEATIQFYKRCLKYFLRFIGNDKFTEDISIEELKAYLMYLKNRERFANSIVKPKIARPVSSVTVQTYIRALRSFCAWLFAEGYIKEDLAGKFKLPRAVKKVIEILSDEEIHNLMKSMKHTTELGLRNSCMVALMLDCGLRRNEVLAIDYDNVHISQSVIKVFGKGQKERIVPLGLYTKKLLLKYIGGFRPMPVYETKRLFLDKECKPISECALKQLFRRLRQKTGIERLHPHILRHTFATKYLMNGGDIFSLQQILGHTSLEMVRRYSHLASSYVVLNYKKYSPLDNLQSQKYRQHDYAEN